MSLARQPLSLMIPNIFFIRRVIYKTDADRPPTFYSWTRLNECFNMREKRTNNNVALSMENCHYLLFNVIKGKSLLMK